MKLWCSLITRTKPWLPPCWASWETEREQSPACTIGKGLSGFEVAPKRTAKLAQNTRSHSGGRPWADSFCLPLYHQPLRVKITRISICPASDRLGGDTDVLRGQRVDQLGQDVFLHHSLSQVIAVVGQPAQSESCCLLDAGDHIQHQRTQHGHHTWGGERRRISW